VCTTAKAVACAAVVLKLHGVYSRSGPRSKPCINLGIWIAAPNLNAPLAMFTPRYSPAHSYISPEPELVHPADFAGREALIHPRFVNYPLCRDQQCCGFSSLEFPH
jgi:hypothetical protein